MSWDTASQIATSLGALLAAASLAAGFVIYRLNQRDEQADGFSLMIGVTRSNIEQLKNMVSYELASDIATTAVYSRDLELPFSDLYEFYAPASGEPPDAEAIKEYLDKYFPVIMVPLSTELVRQYETHTTSVASDVAIYQASFPGVYRVVNSTALLYRNVLVNAREIARDEKLWKQFLPPLIASDRVTSLPHLKWMTGELLTDLVVHHLKNSREQVRLVIQMLDLTFETYLRMTPAELRTAGRAERRERIQPVSFTKTITEDLREAEKCLHGVFSASQLEQYRTLLSEFEQTAKSAPQESDKPAPEPAPDPAPEPVAVAASTADVEADQLGDTSED
jgi:hypothetical protein